MICDISHRSCSKKGNHSVPATVSCAPRIPECWTWPSKPEFRLDASNAQPPHVSHSLTLQRRPSTGCEVCQASRSSLLAHSTAFLATFHHHQAFGSRWSAPSAVLVSIVQPGRVFKFHKLFWLRFLSWLTTFAAFLFYDPHHHGSSLAFFIAEILIF